MKDTIPLPYQLINTAKRLKQQIKKLAEPEDQRAIPYQLLSTLDNKGRSIMELAAIMQCSKQEVSRQVQRADQLGWIELKPDPKDGRSKRVFFSPAGKDCLKQGRQHYRDLEQQWQDKLGKEKLTTLKELLAELDELI